MLEKKNGIQHHFDGGIQEHDPRITQILTKADPERVKAYCDNEDLRVLTILYGDQVGSLAQQSDHTNRESYQLRNEFRRIYKEVTKQFQRFDFGFPDAPPGGYHVEYDGDAFLAVFSQPSEAVRCALYLQKAYRDSPESFAVRIGLHDGQVVFRSEATMTEICGREVGLCSRIAALAQGGQILLSRSVFDKARTNIAPADVPELADLDWMNWGAYYFEGVNWKGKAESYEICEVGELHRISSSRPEKNAKAWPADFQLEEEGWRPAKERVVPGTNWELIDRLGNRNTDNNTSIEYEGKFGEVWKVWSPSLKTYRAFKFCFSKKGVDTLKREARLLEKLREHPHPNIVTIFDLKDVIVHDEKQGGIPLRYLEMEYVEGPSGKEASLANWLNDNPSCNERLEIIAQVADALDAIHAIGIYHRDIKPSNILVTRRQDGLFQAKLTDFGLGATENPELLESIRASQAEGIVGTLDYIAPELKQIDNNTPKPTQQSDLFSLGITLYQVVIGDLNATVGTGWEKRLPSEILREDVAHCTEEKPGNRFAHAKELATALRNHDQRKRAKRLRRIVGYTLTFAFLLTVIMTYTLRQKARIEEQKQLAFNNMQMANKQKEIAQERTKEAETERKTAKRRLAEHEDYQGYVWYREHADPLRALFHFSKAVEDGQGTGFDISTAALWIQQLAYHTPKMVLVHSESVENATFSPNGKWILTVSDNTASVWDIVTGKPVSKPMMHEDIVGSAAFSPDGARVVTASGKTTCVWDAITGKPVTKPINHEKKVNSATFSPDGKWILTASLDGTARVWDAASVNPVSKPMSGEVVIESATFSPDGKWVLTTSGNTARVWDAASGNPVSKPMSGEVVIESASFSPDGKWVLIVSTRSSRVWYAATGNTVSKPMVHWDDVKSATFSPDGKWVLTASSDKTACVWYAATGEPMGEPMNHEDFINSATFSPDGKWVVTASRDKTARVWDALTGKPVSEPMNHEERVLSASFSCDEKWVLTTSGNTARVWDAAMGKSMGISMEHEDDVDSATFSPDGKWVLTESGKIVRVWDTATGKPMSEPMNHEEIVKSATFSPDGKWVLTTSYKLARVWDALTGKPVSEPMNHKEQVLSASFSNDEKWVLTTSGNTARVWDAAMGKPMGISMEHEDIVYSATFSPDGKWILTASGNTARVWDTVRGKPVGEPMKHDFTVISAIFSYDGKWVLTTSGNTARVWDAAMGKPMGILMEHEYDVYSATFSPDGRLILTTSVDTVYLWDATTGKLINDPMKHQNIVNSATFSPDGKWILTTSGNTARTWEVGAVVNAMPAWMPKAPEALTGMRLDGTERLLPIPSDEYLVLREQFFVELRSAAKAGDEAAQFVIRRWEPELGGIWTHDRK